MLQMQIFTLQRKGPVRVVGGNKIKQYRPNSATRENIKELKRELEELKNAREALQEAESTSKTVAPRTKVVTRNFVANQKGVGTQDDDKLALSLANILMITEKTDITLGKWVTEINKDPELTLLRRAILDGKTRGYPPNYKLYEGDLRVDMGLVFVADKMAVPKTLTV